jgi:hypothetical protein
MNNNKYNIQIQYGGKDYIDNCIFKSNYLKCRYIGTFAFGISLKKY